MNPQLVGIRTFDTDLEHAGVLRRGRVGQRVAVVIREFVIKRPDGVVPAPQEGKAGLEVGRFRTPRRPVGPGGPGFGPGACALHAGDRAHLHFVGGAGLQVREGERAVGGVHRAGEARPRGGVRALSGLLAVLRLITGDRQPVGRRGRPAHVQPRGRRLAVLRAGQRRCAGLAGFDVRHLN